MPDDRFSAISESFPPSPTESFLSQHSFHVDNFADSAVSGAIKMARHLLKTDPHGYFLYAKPRPRVEQLSDTDSLSGASTDSHFSEHDEISWCTIQYFSLNDMMNQLREYINRWHLSPATKFVLITQQGEEAKYYGRRYYIDAVFSKPTPSCPNPLATARAHFTIHVSDLLPKDYPVMITYKFEGYKTIYFVIGEKALPSMSFQRYFIDSLLHIKLTFYSEIFQCRHSSAGSKPEMRRGPHDLDEDYYTEEDDEMFSRHESRAEFFAN